MNETAAYCGRSANQSIKADSGVQDLSQNIVRVLSTFVGISFIGIGVMLLAYSLPFSPFPDWAHSVVFLFLGVGLFSYGVTGTSRILRQFRRRSD